MKSTETNQGAIFLNRKIMSWQHFDQPSYLTVFITLLLVANHCERWWKGIKIERGETVITVKSLSKICNLTPPTVHKVLKGLVESGEIERRKAKNFHKITRIVNYNDYQALGSPVCKKDLQHPLHKQELKHTIIERDNIYKGDFELLKEMLDSKIIVEQFCKNEGITVGQFKRLAHETIFDWKLTGTTHASETDAKRHLLNTVRVKIRINNIVSNDMKSRLEPFIAACKDLIAQGFPAGDVRDFYSYWIQPCNDRSGRMLFESVKAFDPETKFKSHFKNR